MHCIICYDYFACCSCIPVPVYRMHDFMFQYVPFRIEFHDVGGCAVGCHTPDAFFGKPAEQVPEPYVVVFRKTSPVVGGECLDVGTVEEHEVVLRYVHIVAEFLEIHAADRRPAEDFRHRRKVFPVARRHRVPVPERDVERSAPVFPVQTVEACFVQEHEQGGRACARRPVVVFVPHPAVVFCLFRVVPEQVEFRRHAVETVRRPRPVVPYPSVAVYEVSVHVVYDGVPGVCPEQDGAAPDERFYVSSAERGHHVFYQREES